MGWNWRWISPSSAAPTIPGCASIPEWFDWRPDGGLRYAENPPKKYEDIVNVDFYRPGAIPGLWLALARRRRFLGSARACGFSASTIPHTKPFAFWEWMIADIRASYPDTLFLSEAFTRPKVMYRLAKLGFSQSYTYFTWRNEKWEIEAYLRELTAANRRPINRRACAASGRHQCRRISSGPTSSSTRRTSIRCFCNTPDAPAF